MLYISLQIFLNWTSPSQPNGQIDHYLIKITPSQITYSTSDNETSMLKAFELQSETQYQFTVTAVNSVFKGVESKPMSLLYRIDLPEIQEFQVSFLCSFFILQFRNTG